MKKRSKLLFVLLNLVLVAALAWAIVHLVYAPGGMRMKLTSNMESVQPKQMVELRFEIHDKDGEVMTDFERVHEKKMHLIVVRADLTQFQHLHPELDEETGEFSVSLSFDEAGSYQLFADFTPKNSTQTVLSTPLTVSDTVSYETIELIPNGPETFELDGFTVTPHFPESIESGSLFTYSFDVLQDEEAVSLETYLGAKGHSVILHEGDLNYDHTHPSEDALSFEAILEESGLYKSFTQFQVNGRVYTIEYTFEVVAGEGPAESMSDHM